MDLISSLSDDILHHILFFVPTKLAIKTSVMSKRWRHVWSDTPGLSFNAKQLYADAINETLTRYTAPKIMKFVLKANMIVEYTFPDMYRWIEFAMSRNVENLSLCVGDTRGYKIPDLFYNSSSIKQLRLEFPYSYMTPKCSVSWTSLKKLSLCYSFISQESILKILSGCPILESLTLNQLNQFKFLDLSKYLRLRTLDIRVSQQTQIVAPHIHCLTLRNYLSLCTLFDVSSLTEAKVDIDIEYRDLGYGLLHVILPTMLNKLENAEKLTCMGNFLMILSLAEVRGVTFPMFKIKALTLETEIFQYVIPGIERLLQNSPDLKMVTVRAREECNIMERQCTNLPSRFFDSYLGFQGLTPDQRWGSKDGVFWNRYRKGLESNHVVSFVELVFKTRKTLDKMVLHLNDYHGWFNIEELLQTLCHNKYVSIVLSSTPLTLYDCDWCET